MLTVVIGTLAATLICHQVDPPADRTLLGIEIYSSLLVLIVR